MLYSRITGTGSYFPEKILTNADLTRMVDTSDEWITARTGIKERRIASADDATSEMAYRASLNAIEAAGIRAEDIDGIIVPTVTPDHAFPSTAAIVQEKLGLKGCFAFDISAACTGFLYGLSIADAFIKSGQYKTILIAASERLSSITDYTDRGTCILFGDGAGAAVVTADSEPGLLCGNMFADGSYGDLLYMHGMGSSYMANRSNTDIEANLIKMKGNELFKQAVLCMTSACEKALDASGLKAEEIDFLLPHQANMRIMEAVAKRFHIGSDKVIINIDRRGNTSAPTIPTALDEAVRSGMVKKGDNIIMCAFGAGLTWGAVVLSL